MISFSREGVTIDLIARFITKTVLNPIIAPAIAALFATEHPALRKALEEVIALLPQTQQVIDHVSANSGTYRIGAYLTAGVSLVIWANKALNKWTLNNWTRDPTWDLNKEIVLVTGAAGGIGQHVIKHLLEKNLKTTIVAVDYIALTWTPPPGSNVHYYQCDLSNSAKLKDMAGRIKRQVGDPTVLVNNAGLCRGRTIMEGSYQDVELTIRTNLTAPLLLLKEFLPAMVRNNHGHIVNVSSLSSVLAPAGVADYSATKAGLLSMTEALQLELRCRHGAPKVRTSVCVFGFIRTPLFKGETRTSNFVMPLVHPDSVGESLASIIESGYGQTLYLPGVARYISMVVSGLLSCLCDLKCVCVCVCARANNSSSAAAPSGSSGGSRPRRRVLVSSSTSRTRRLTPRLGTCRGMSRH